MGRRGLSRGRLWVPKRLGNGPMSWQGGLGGVGCARQAWVSKQWAGRTFPPHPSPPAGLGSEAGLGTPPDLGALRCLNPGLSAASIQMGTGAPSPKCPRQK